MKGSGNDSPAPGELEAESQAQSAPSQTLRSKIQTLFVALIGLMGILVVITSAVQSEMQVEGQVRQDAEAITSLLTSQVTEQRRNLLAHTELIAQIPTLREANGHKSIGTYAPLFRKQIRADGLALFKRDGTLIVKEGGFGNVGDGKELKRAIAFALKGQSWSGVIVPGRELMLVAVAPVRGSGRVAGVLVLRIFGDGMAKQLRDGSRAEVAFMVGSKVVASSLPIEMPMGRVANAWTIVEIKGREYVARYTPFPGTEVDKQLGFVALRELEGIKAPYRAMTVTFTIVLLLAIVVTILFTGAFARDITRPLEATVTAALQLRDGGWPEPLQVVRQDEIGVLQSVFNDMTVAMRSSQERLVSLLDTDPLTELDNHRRFKERVDQEVFRAQLGPEPLSLALVDIDGFKAYNERFGHAAGDEALKTLGALMRQVAPKQAFLARYGGEEFAILMPDTDAEIAEEIANRLRALVSTTLKAPFTLSIGVAEVAEGITTGSALQLSAELALGRAKQLGKDRVCRFESVPGASEAEDPFQLQKFLEDTTFATIQTLAAAVDAKDPYTQGHSARVAKFASDLARYVGFSPAEVDLIYRTGTLHDVGKIGVPDSILKKPTKLDDEELRIIETHPVLGEIIVKRAPQLEEMLPGVRHHHERWDGKGYPDGLMGDQIPRIARVIAVADTFDAMTSDRPYRRGLTPERALLEIEKGAGTQFEPSLALAFVRMMRLNGSVIRAA